MNIDAAVETYLAESLELLDVMEQALLSLEHDVTNHDHINAIFRAAHTIKGSGGIFGFDIIVDFTHQVESLLDRVREGWITPDPDLIALLLECCDHTRNLLAPASSGEEPTETLIKKDERLQASLKGYLKTRATDHPPLLAEPTGTAAQTSTPDNPVATDLWHISVYFGPYVFQNGMDPLSFFRYLGRFAEITSLIPLLDTAPSLSEIDPELCYMGFALALKSDAALADIEGAFEFVRQDCKLHILPPHSNLSKYIEALNECQNDRERLSDILLATSILTPAELAQGLSPANAANTPQCPVLETPEQPISAPSAESPAKPGKDGKTSEKRFIRIDGDHLHLLINLIGELVIAGANTHLMAKRAGVVNVMESAANLSRLIEEVRNIALGLQMVQIGTTFQRFQRIVHDVSKELGKEIELSINGGDTELDKSVVEQISDPLMHLVRNAMDHGIEPVEERLRHGKPRYGTVTLNAYHDSGSIVLEVADDGYGLDRDKLLAKAVERGIRNPNQTLTDDDIYELVFEPGFSTAERVSSLSGRGVGMDVVRRNVEALKGNIHMESEPGIGTLVRIRLPLTLAIIDGFLISVGEERYIIPMDMLVECLEHDQESRIKVEQQGYLDVRGELLPVIRLADLFGIASSQQSRRESIVVVRYGQQRAGLVVDELLGEFQTVIKPLGDLFSRLTTISGSTILGSGEVALIIDVPGLINHILTLHHQRQKAETHKANGS